MPEILNCPNCNAPVDGEKCEYCGTVFHDFTSLSFDKPTYIKIDVGGGKMIAKAYLSDLEIADTSYTESYSRLDGMLRLRRVPDVTLSAKFHLIDNDGTVYTWKRGVLTNGWNDKP